MSSMRKIFIHLKPYLTYMGEKVLETKSFCYKQ